MRPKAPKAYEYADWAYMYPLWVYRCPKCGREVTVRKVPGGRYYCKECGPGYILIPVRPATSKGKRKLIKEEPKTEYVYWVYEWPEMRKVDSQKTLADAEKRLKQFGEPDKEYVILKLLKEYRIEEVA
ncbi:hypothetical protein DRO69_11075 [Candidatus Bathyarchaeota archaeon]|nr:MAG: hypothetical protein DRO69_11075 [Candidatus Bathyarchaeota archaeon]